MPWTQLSHCVRCGDPIALTEIRVQRLERLFSTRGNMVVKYCCRCQDVNFLRMVKQLAQEGTDELIEQGECIGDGEL